MIFATWFVKLYCKIFLFMLLGKNKPEKLRKKAEWFTNYIVKWLIDLIEN